MMEPFPENPFPPESPPPMPAMPAPALTSLGLPPVLPPKKKTWLQKLLAPLGAAGVMIAKFLATFKFAILAVLKFGWPFLKTGGTMLISMWFYAQLFGWWFAAGFVVLIFVHECGHLLVAKYFRLPVSAPMFIPFLGAVILLKQSPRNAWVEACVGIGGPLFGSLGAGVCAIIYLTTGNPLYEALANIGFFLNLFNLAPVSPLDGGRIVTALSPWLWIAGYVIMGAYLIYRPNLILIIVMVMGLRRLFSLFRPKTAEQRRYFEVTTPQRFVMATMYFGLIVLLLIGMDLTNIPHP
jgi:Zn-dependent protease